MKQERIDDCNGRDDKCGRNEAILMRSRAVLAILIREPAVGRSENPKTKTGPGESLSLEIKKSGFKLTL
jgi:hypothetical protein